MGFESFNTTNTSEKNNKIPENIFETETNRLQEILKSNPTRRGLRIINAFALSTLLAYATVGNAEERDIEEPKNQSNITQVGSQQDRDFRKNIQKQRHEHIAKSVRRAAAASDIAELMGMQFDISDFETKTKDGQIVEINNIPVPQDISDDYYDLAEKKQTEAQTFEADDEF